MTSSEASAAPAERWIGPYRILRLLGAGGMGKVWLAQQAQPSREVALKVAGAAAPDLARRLRREIETLAALEHPGIARLYAAGEAEVDGQYTPWLAMEYVSGVDVLAHAEAHRLDLHARLRLLIQILRAVDYAHRRGVVHRDLKPGNILVGAGGRPRVLDFGIAWRSDQAGPALTLAGQVLGTVPYISPEQLLRGERSADPRSDVYALGVIAYQLIGGSLPYPRLATSDLLEALDILRHQEPLPLASVSAAARGDLETVVMKALAGEPAQRYASAAAFADDLERVLAHHPVFARRPTLGYRAARFVRRHRALSAAAAVIFVVLVGASMISLRFAWAERAAHAEADRRAREAAAVSDFLSDMLAAANPEVTGGRQPPVSELVSNAELQLDALAAEPAVQRRVAGTLARTRHALGDYAAALALNQRALALATDVDAAQRSKLFAERAAILTDLGRFDEARESLAAARAAWPQADRTARYAFDLEATRIDSDQGRVGQAEQGLRALLARAERLDPASLAAAPELTATLVAARSSLSTLLREAGALEESEALIRSVLAWRSERYGVRAPTTLVSRHNLALVLYARGEYAQAEQELREIIALQSEVLGEAHAATLTSWQTLANVLIRENRLNEAEAAARTSMEGFERSAGADHVQTLAAMNSLAYILEQRGDLPAAEAMYRRIIAIQSATGSEHPTTFAARNNLAMLLLKQERAAEAEEAFADLLRDARAALGDEHLLSAIFASNHGLGLSRLQRYAEARDELEWAHARLLALVGPEHERTRTAAARLAEVESALGPPTGTQPTKTAQ